MINKTSFLFIQELPNDPQSVKIFYSILQQDPTILYQNTRLNKTTKYSVSKNKILVITKQFADDNSFLTYKFSEQSLSSPKIPQESIIISKSIVQGTQLFAKGLNHIFSFLGSQEQNTSTPESNYLKNSNVVINWYQ